MFGTASGLALACGINAYFPLFVLGVAARSGNIRLQDGFGWLQSPGVLAGLLALALLDLVLDKIPAADHAWDVIHTAARPIAAVLCVAAVVNVDSGVARALLAVVGGALGGAVHTGKATARLAASGGGGGLLSLPISLAEDAVVVLIVTLAFLAPKLTLALAALFVALCIWFAPTLLYVVRLQWHVVRAVLASLRGSGAPPTIEVARQRSLFRAPDWALHAATALSGPDEPLRLALRMTARGPALPRHGWLLASERRLFIAGRSLLRRERIVEIPLLYVRVARLDHGWLFSRLDLLDLDGRRYAVRFVEDDDLLVQDVAELTIASLPPDANRAIAGPRPIARRIG